MSTSTTTTAAAAAPDPLMPFRSLLKPSKNQLHTTQATNADAADAAGSHDVPSKKKKGSLMKALRKSVVDRFYPMQPSPSPAAASSSSSSTAAVAHEKVSEVCARTFVCLCSLSTLYIACLAG